MKNTDLQTVRLSLDELTPYANNAKEHPEEQLDQIRESIQRFGFCDPIAVWGDDNTIVEGHGRYLVLKEMGETEVDCIRLDHLTDEERRAYTLAHNKLTMNSGFDFEILNGELGSITSIDMEAFGFEPEEELTDFQEDDFDPTPPDEPVSKMGQVYNLGGVHRLMVGDSTDPDDVNRLMNGEEADLLLTDPPYNVAYEGGTKDSLTIANDSMDDRAFEEFLTRALQNGFDHMKDGAAWYIWYASRNVTEFVGALENVGTFPKQQLIWNKSTFTLGRQDYQWKHEPCLYGWKDGATHYFTDDRRHTTIWSEDAPDFKTMKKQELVELLEKQYEELATTVMDYDKPSANRLHPTMKPVGLIGYQLQNSTRPGELVLDLFGGSGSTLIAAEQSGRRCYMMEYDPQYADVIINRWEQLTGKKAELIQ